MIEAFVHVPVVVSPTSNLRQPIDTEQVEPSSVLVRFVQPAGTDGFVVEPSRKANTTAQSPLLNDGSVALVVPVAAPTKEMAMAYQRNPDWVTRIGATLGSPATAALNVAILATQLLLVMVP